MKTLLNLFICVLISGSLFAQRTVDHLGISQTGIDVTTATTVGELTINPTEAGKVIVRFDGDCYASVGDRIIVAASNTTNWGINDGNIGIEVIDGDLNHRSFSHTRVYDVAAGSHTFYAIAHNYVETDGDGMTSIYGSLTVEFVPATAGIVEHTGITSGSLDLSSLTTVTSTTIAPTEPGKVIVRFDGACYASVGDRIILASSDAPSWTANDGNIGVEVYDTDLNNNTFSHTRVYDVTAGSHTFYAVAQNYVETDGDAMATIYGSFTVQFVPTTGGMVGFQGIGTSNPDVSTTTAMGQVTIAPTVAGKAIVSFDGDCYASVGDLLVLAASNSMNWTANDGNVGVECYDTDLNHESFSHTRVYDVVAGSQTFYGLAQNYVETDGDGSAAIYGSLVVSFVPNPSSSGINGVDEVELSVYPNPTNGQVRIDLGSTMEEHTINIYNANGALVASEQVNRKASFDYQLPAVKGIYLVQLVNENGASKTVKVINE